MRGEAEPTWWTCSSALGSPAMNVGVRSLSLISAHACASCDDGAVARCARGARRRRRSRPQPAAATTQTERRPAATKPAVPADAVDRDAGDRRAAAAPAVMRDAVPAQRLAADRAGHRLRQRVDGRGDRRGAERCRRRTAAAPSVSGFARERRRQRGAASSAEQQRHRDGAVQRAVDDPADRRAEPPDRELPADPGLVAACARSAATMPTSVPRQHRASAASAQREQDGEHGRRVQSRPVCGRLRRRRPSAPRAAGSPSSSTTPPSDRARARSRTAPTTCGR